MKEWGKSSRILAYKELGRKEDNSDIELDCSEEYMKLKFCFCSIGYFKRWELKYYL